MFPGYQRVLWSTTGSKFFVGISSKRVRFVFICFTHARTLAFERFPIINNIIQCFLGTLLLVIILAKQARICKWYCLLGTSFQTSNHYRPNTWWLIMSMTSSCLEHWGCPEYSRGDSFFLDNFDVDFSSFVTKCYLVNINHLESVWLEWIP